MFERVLKFKTTFLKPIQSFKLTASEYVSKSYYEAYVATLVEKVRVGLKNMRRFPQAAATK